MPSKEVFAKFSEIIDININGAENDMGAKN